MNNKIKTPTTDKDCIDFKAVSYYLKSMGAKWAIVEQEGLEIPSIEAAKLTVYRTAHKNFTHSVQTLQDNFIVKIIECFLQNHNEY